MNKKIIILICAIVFILLGISRYTNKGTSITLNQNGLPKNWGKDPEEVMKVYITALNDKNIELMNECIYSNKEYDSKYLGFGIPSKERLDNIEYIKYIDSEKSTFRKTQGMLENGKVISFKEGRALEVEYDVKYKIENEPEESGINYSRYILSKDTDGNYKIIGAGY